MIRRIKGKLNLSNRRTAQKKRIGWQKRKRFPLENKVNAIAALAQKEYEEGKAIRIGVGVTGHTGREVFLAALGVRRNLHSVLLREFPEFEERKRVYLSTPNAHEKIKRDTELINDWLESEGKPKLKITGDELVRIIIE